MKRIALPSFALAAIGIVFSCSPTVNQPSCPAFRPGADFSGGPFGQDSTIQAQVDAYAQAAGDIDVAVAAALVNVTEACRRIAIDLGADPSGVGALDAALTADSGVDAGGAAGLGGA